jgi:hypothetical protein
MYLPNTHPIEHLNDPVLRQRLKSLYIGTRTHAPRTEIFNAVQMSRAEQGQKPLVLRNARTIIRTNTTETAPNHLTNLTDFRLEASLPFSLSLIDES